MVYSHVGVLEHLPLVMRGERVWAVTSEQFLSRETMSQVLSAFFFFGVDEGGS